MAVGSYTIGPGGGRVYACTDDVADSPIMACRNFVGGSIQVPAGASTMSIYVGSDPGDRGTFALADAGDGTPFLDVAVSAGDLHSLDAIFEDSWYVIAVFDVAGDATILFKT